MGAEFTHLLDSLGWAVLHSIWQGGLAFLFVIIWRAALRGHSPALRHAGQITALLGCLVAFMWTFAVYLGLPEIGTQSGATLSAATGTNSPRMLSGLIAPFDPAAVQAELSLSRITPILACLWAFGFAAMSLRYAFAFGQVQQLRTLGLQRPDAAWTSKFMQLARDIGVSNKVRLYISANVAGPMTLGLIKPVVLVPIGFLTGLPANQVEAILRHELAHIRRYDYALNLLQTGVKTVLFYHPAIHIICRWADQDREQACDDLAVKQGRDPLSLARGLAALRLQAQPNLVMAATGKGEDMPLMDRLTRLAGQTPKRGRPEHILMSVLSALLLGSVYLGASARAEAHPHPVPPTMPDTIINSNRRVPVPPVPPVPPVLTEMDFSQLKNGDAMQRFIDTDKAAYRAFATEMERYAAELETYLESSDFGEEEREIFEEQYEDLADDISDIFEDRRETIEELYEDQIERKQEEKEAKAEWKQELKEIEAEYLAEMKGLEGAIKGIEAAEHHWQSKPESDSKKAELKALKQARKDIEKAKREISMAQSQAATAESVARAKANQKQARKLQAEARQQQAEARRQQTEARRQASLARKNAEYASKKAHVEIDRRSQKRHDDFRNKIMTELLKDGLIKSKNETVFLSHPDGQMSLNGQAMPKSVRGKYCDLWDAYGFEDDKSEITIKPDSLTILTDWKNGQHTTRVTYGSFDTEKTSH